MDIAGKRKIDGIGTLAMLTALVCWTAGPIFIRYLTAYLDFWTQNFLRYTAASLFLLPGLLRGMNKGTVGKKILWVSLLPAVANVAMQSLWTSAYYYIEPGFVNLLGKSSIVWIAGFSMIFFVEERVLLVSKRFWAGLVLSVLGVVGVTVFKENFTAKATLIGVVLSLGSGLGWGMYTVAAKVAFRQTDSRMGFAIVSLYSTLLLMVLALLFGKPAECLAMNVQAWVFVVVSGIISIGIAHVLFYVSMRRLGATIPSLAILVLPFSVLVISNMFYGETVTSAQAVAGVVLVAGAGIAVWAQEKLHDRR